MQTADHLVDEKIPRWDEKTIRIYTGQGLSINHQQDSNDNCGKQVRQYSRQPNEFVKHSGWRMKSLVTRQNKNDEICRKTFRYSHYRISTTDYHTDNAC
jgi:hypothetical protein